MVIYEVMKVNPGIFRAYDIRGKYPAELNEAAAFSIGKAFVAFLRRREKRKKLHVGIGRDTRLSSPKLFSALAASLREEGCDVIDLGVISTPQLYFAVWRYKLQGGAMITASHNPNPYNGIKFTREQAIPLGGETGLLWMRQYIEKYAPFKSEKRKAGIQKKNNEKIYVSWNLARAKVKKGSLGGISLALDAGNGVGGKVTFALLKEAGVKVYPLYLNPDGRFPNHVPDPQKPENVRDLQKLMQQKKPNLGVALDGDADRIVFLDEKGKALRGDLVTALLASLLAKKGERMLYDIRSSNSVPEAMKEAGVLPSATRIGHALIKEHMRKTKAAFAGEYTGHYYLGKGLFFEAPLFFLLVLLKEMKRSSLLLSELVSPFDRYAYSGEINFPTHKKEETMKKLKVRYSKGKQTQLDGLRVDFSDWWFLLRASNTEPLLRLVVEAKTKKLLSEKQKELTLLLRS
ncbi:MAG: phosphomannomutase/phosphoglucomutase [bacterium]|nr:phosphomannomutase/phosphoglucomutase [bacterium]